METEPRKTMDRRVKRKSLDRVQHCELLLLLLFYLIKAPPVAMKMMEKVQTGKHCDQPMGTKTPLLLSG